MIVFYIDPQSYNNLELYDRSLIESFRLCEVYFFCSRRIQFPVSVYKTLKIFNYQNFNNKIIKALSYLNSLFRIFLYIQKLHPEVIHFQWFKIPIFDYIFLRLLKLCNSKAKLIFTAHNVLPHNSGLRYVNSFRRLYRTLDLIIVHTNGTKIEIKKMDVETKIIVIPHGLLNYPISNKNKDDDSVFVFSFIGSISYYKGIDILVESWLNSSVLNNNAKVKLIVAGSGIIPKLENLSDISNVKIINRFLTDEELCDVFIESDVILLPYREISQSGVLLTALAFHKFVIVSNLDGLVQPFEISPIGVILNNTDSQSLSSEMISAFNNASVIKELNQDISIWSEIESFYSWERIGKITEEVYKYE